MLRNARSTVSHPRTLNTLRRALSSSSSCCSPATSESPHPKAKSPQTRLYRDKTADPSSSSGRRSTATRPPFTRSDQTSKPPLKTNSESGTRWPKATRKKTSETILLRPPALAERVTNAAGAGLINEAVEMVQNAPLDAQNVVVWNTLLKAVMNDRKYKLAYSLYVDMKRRGFVPNMRTYGTMMQGYTQIEDWTVFTQQLENVHKLWDGYMELVETHRLQGNNPNEVVNNPLTSYLTILGKAGQWQRLFDVYNNLNPDVPPVPNKFTYSAIFEALDARRQLPGFTEAQVFTQNASDAKLIWKQMLKVSAKLGFEVDSHLVRFILRILGRGGPSDHLLAYDIVREYLGLAPPGQEPAKAKIPLNRYLLEPVLHLCVKAQKPALCLHYLQQAMETHPGVVTAAQCDVALHANAMQAAKGSLSESTRALEIVSWMLEHDALANASGARGADARLLRPRPKTLRLALTACWRGADWDTATRIFERLTRFEVGRFADGAHTPPPGGAARGKGRAMDPDAGALSLVARSALASGEVANMRQCLRLVEHIGVDVLEGKDVKIYDGEPDRDAPYHHATYARAVVDLANTVLKAEAAEGGYTVTPEEKQRWETLRRTAKQALAQHPEWKNAQPPPLEASTLGSVRGMSAMEAHVDHQMTHRHLKSA